MCNSLFLKKLMKKNCVLSKKINGNISKINDNELRRDKYKGKNVLTLISLKKSNSLNKFNINTNPNIIKKMFRNDLKNTKIINLI
tara:strand:+ start:119 stop:373 length:255 start_codon:yes stop_codon:yes gene_type:complete